MCCRNKQKEQEIGAVVYLWSIKMHTKEKKAWLLAALWTYHPNMYQSKGMPVLNNEYYFNLLCNLSSCQRSSHIIELSLGSLLNEGIDVLNKIKEAGYIFCWTLLRGIRKLNNQFRIKLNWNQSTRDILFTCQFNNIHSF